MTLCLVTFKQVSVRTPASKLGLLFDQIAGEEADSDWCGAVHLIFTTDAAIRKLNARYRQRNVNTDVLSFNLDKPVDSESIFGEIYISINSARRQASEYGGKLSSELLRLFCHGMLHLLGYDHDNKSSSGRMRRREAYFLGKIGEEFVS